MFNNNFFSKAVLSSMFLLTISSVYLKSVCKNKVLCVGGVTCDIFIDIDKKT